MPELENVIKGLGVCSPTGCAKEKCPYYEGPESEFWGNPDGYECEFNLRQDAIKLLKAQGPRVMTLDEALNSLVIEYRNGKLQVVGKLVLTKGHEYYGNLWRVWDRMPTDEQREATPWH